MSINLGYLDRAQKPWKPGDERNTPRDFARLVNRYVPCFGFAPCWTSRCHVRVRLGVTYERDSLDFERWRWPLYRSIWLQPPYSDPGPFVERLLGAHLHRAALNRDHDYLMLGRGDWTTRWFRALNCYGVGCLLDQRLAFELDGESDNAAKFPSVLFYVGADPRRFIRFWRPHGAILPKRGDTP